MSQGDGRIVWMLVAAVIASALLVAPAGAGDTDESPLRLELEPLGRTVVPKGAPLRFRVMVENPTAEDAAIELRFGLRDLRGGEEIWFGRADRDAGPGETAVRGRVIPAQWFARSGPYRLTVESSFGASDRLRFRVRPATVGVPRFRDVTAQVGLSTEHHIGTTCNGTHAAGAAWGDVDGDDDLDLFVPDQTDPARLWVNDGGSFTEGATAAGVDNGTREGYGAVFVDYDNDGDQDLYVVNDGADRLYRNDGTGQFTDVAVEAGVADTLPGTSASWADYDGNGRLDLFVSRWGRCPVDEYLDDTLYRGASDGTFADRTAALGATGPTNGRGFIGGWLDYDRDGDQDLYLANDFAVGPDPKPNVLWRNDGPGVGGSWLFANVSAASGAGPAMNSMGLGIGDYDRDLDLDLAISNIRATALLANQGDGTFQDRAEAARVARPVQRLVPSTLGLVEQPSVTWGLAFHDLNNDGWEDLYVAAGSMIAGDYASIDGPQPNELFVNQGNGRFFDLSAPSRADDPGSSRGIAFADYDRDGRVDMYVVNRGGEPRLYRNVTKARGMRWLEVDTIGRQSNRDGCGARLVATVGGEKMLRQVSCGSTSLASGSDSTVHFGLGRAQKVQELRIEWPSGVVQKLRNVRADRLIRIREPGP